MAERNRREDRSRRAESGELEELVTKWVEVLDRWVRQFDDGMGVTAQGGDPAADSSPDPTPALPLPTVACRAGCHEGEGELLSEGQEQERVYADKQLVITRTGSPDGLVLTGAIDHFNASAVARSIGAELRSVPGGAAGIDHDAGRADLHLDVSGLEFTDVSGIRALVLVGEGAGEGRRLVLHGLPAAIHKAVSIVGWADLPYLVLDPE